MNRRALRAAVLGDIAYHDYSAKDHDAVRESTTRWYRDYFGIPRAMSFSEWARNIRTVKLMEIKQRLDERLRDAELSNASKQDKINSLTDSLKVAEEERDLARLQLRARGVELTAAEDEIERRVKNIDKLESDLRLTKSILDTYIRCAKGQLEKIEKLENTVKVNSDFIELQARRLSNARMVLARVSTVVSAAAGLATPDLSSLDP